MTLLSNTMQSDGMYLCEIIPKDHSLGHSTDLDSSLLSRNQDNSSVDQHTILYCLKYCIHETTWLIQVVYYAVWNSWIYGLFFSTLLSFEGCP